MPESQDLFPTTPIAATAAAAAIPLRSKQPASAAEGDRETQPPSASIAAAAGKQPALAEREAAASGVAQYARNGLPAAGSGSRDSAVGSDDEGAAVGSDDEEGALNAGAAASGVDESVEDGDGDEEELISDDERASSSSSSSGSDSDSEAEPEEEEGGGPDIVHQVHTSQNDGPMPSLQWTHMHVEVWS